MFLKNIKNKITVLNKHEKVLDKIVKFLNKLGVINDEDEINKTRKYVFIDKFVYLNTLSIVISNEVERRSDLGLDSKTQDEIDEIVSEVIMRLSEYLSNQSSHSNHNDIDWK